MRFVIDSKLLDFALKNGVECIVETKYSLYYGVPYTGFFTNKVDDRYPNYIELEYREGGSVYIDPKDIIDIKLPFGNEVLNTSLWKLIAWI